MEGRTRTQLGPAQGTHSLYTGIGDVMATKLDRISELSSTFMVDATTNLRVRSRVRKLRKHGSVRGERREALSYSTENPTNGLNRSFFILQQWLKQAGCRLFCSF